MPHRLKLVGHKYGRLTVVAGTYKTHHGHSMWECLCECGNIKTATAEMLRSGKTQSCGCLKVELNTKWGHILGSMQGRRNVARKIGIYGLSLEERRINSLKAVEVNRANSTAIFAPGVSAKGYQNGMSKFSFAELSDAGRKGGRAAAKVNAPALARHTRWHINRGITNPECTLCAQENN